ncbi:hypothetical protein LINGRAHAP2_LOCUS29995 [Linum grandiflorum]
MNLISWNCRGLGPPLTGDHLQRFVRELKPSILFLMETKNQKDFMEWKRMKLNFANGVLVDPINTAGGLALRWIADLNINVIRSSSSYFHVFINYGSGFFCTFIYAPTTAADRRQLWNEINSFGPGGDELWLVIGDLNVVLYDHEKSGGNPVAYDSAAPLRSFIFNNALSDLGFVGNPFTWSNKKQQPDLIKERNDRGLVTVGWRTAFDKATLFHDECIGSDHCPLRIEFNGSRNRTATPFRFDSRWLGKEECAVIIHDDWANDGSVAEKLAACSLNLKNWAADELNTRMARQREIKSLLAMRSIKT